MTDRDDLPDVPRPDAHLFLLFGATGDLAKRKLFPGFYRLAAAGRMPESYAIVGTGRHSPGDDDEFRSQVADAVRDSLDSVDDDVLDDLTSRVRFQTSSSDDLDDLVAAVADAESGLDTDGTPERLVYLSLPPSAMESMVPALGEASLLDNARLVVEKPFGTDLESSRELDAALKKVVDEDQVFRIDHFLGKEAVQNVIALRWGNGPIDAVWSREFVESVQIDVPEELGLEGRGSFYESTGAFRDMISTHLCQILGFMAMERPDALDAESVRDAKSQVFRQMRPFTADDVVLGQFEGYRDEEDVAPDSDVETFVAIRAFVDNDRWRDVPFFLRTGKAMAATRRTVTLTFREPEHGLLKHEEQKQVPGPTELSMELGDGTHLAYDLRAKQPGPGLELTTAELVADYDEEFDTAPLEAYERLLLDVMHGEQMLFTRSDEVDRLWELCDPIIKNPPTPLPYEKGSWGPQEAVDLPGEHGWRIQR
ncbi:glucose-6-phosphate dehydrogenase [Solicola sp. PLA-1-18]|uniref:glucose-6-phosphate dehydrogenase n=1 Tax=Solicola sp. PLA-1-18 TaxID=3380532 RepID=UPI003B78A16E